VETVVVVESGDVSAPAPNVVSTLADPPQAASTRAQHTINAIRNRFIMSLARQNRTRGG
jgi:hypothetical protein